MREMCVHRPGIQVTVCVCVCLSVPALQGHMEGTGLLVQGAKKETINPHCDAQTRLGSHGWVMGAMEVIGIRCGSIINKNGQDNGQFNAQFHQTGYSKCCENCLKSKYSIFSETNVSQF